jgi:hypothetical protein
MMIMMMINVKKKGYPTAAHSGARKWPHCPLTSVYNNNTEKNYSFCFLWLDSPIWAWASSFRRGFTITHI